MCDMPAGVSLCSKPRFEGFTLMHDHTHIYIYGTEG